MFPRRCHVNRCDVTAGRWPASAGLTVCAALLLTSSWGHSANLDTLHFGDSASESAHNLLANNATPSTTTLGETSRRLNTGGQMYFDLAVDGAAQNYATVRFWGGATSVSGRLFLGDQSGNYINWAQLDDSSSAEVTPDRWHYATVPLPRSMTDGKSSVRFSLYAMNNNSTYSNPPPSGTQTSPTRPIYAAFTHTDNRFTVPDGVAQNPVVAPYDYGTYQQPSSAEIADWTDHLTDLANGIASQVANMQVTGTAGLPSSLLGAFDIRTGATGDATLNATHSHHINTDNLGPLRGATILAHSYNMPGGVYEGNASILQRIAWGIDYARRAQGNTGGYVDVHSPITWIGGGTATNPDRVLNEGTGSLEGITHQEIAKAFLMTHTAMESAGLLDQLIDDDNKPATPMITRRQAYEDLFREFVDFHTGYFGGQQNDPYQPTERGHAPNQDLYQVGGLAWAMEALETLNPTAFDPDPGTSHAIAQAELKTRAYEAAGITITPFNNSWWFSPAGLPLEAGGLKAGGFSSEYGQRQSEDIWDIAQIVDDPADQAPLLEMAANSANLWQNFWYPIYRTDGSFDMRLEGAINWRNSKIKGLEGKFPAYFAALDMIDPAVGRMLQLLVKNDQLNIEAPRGGHSWQDGVWMMEQVAEITRLLGELPETDSSRLPHEAGQPDFAWIDPVGGAVAVKHGDSHIFMALNWHHGSSGSTPLVNDIARIHEITPLDDRIATVTMENPDGFGALSYLFYGDLLVAANAHQTNSYPLAVPAPYAAQVFDLVTGTYLSLTGSVLNVTPGQSAVLVLDDLLPLLAGDYDVDGDVDADDYMVWRSSFGGTHLAADGNGDGIVDAADYAVWRDNVGASLGMGAVTANGTTQVPEPSAGSLLISAVMVWAGVALCRRQAGRNQRCRVYIPRNANVGCRRC